MFLLKVNRKLIIQHLKSLYHKLSIHPITLGYFLFSWLGGYLKWYLSTLLIVCLHEICHLLMAYYFHFQIKKIELLPFGAYLHLEDFYFQSIWKEMCVVLAGPCSHLFIYAGIQMLSHGVYQDFLLTMNMFVLCFNLLPIYPLDGGRFLSLLLQSIMDLKKSLFLTLKISIFVYCLLFLFYLQMNTVVILCYLFYQLCCFYRFIFIYLRTYYGRIPSFSNQRPPLVHDRIIYRRGYHNYYVIDQKMRDEKEIVPEFLKSIKK